MNRHTIKLVIRSNHLVSVLAFLQRVTGARSNSYGEQVAERSRYYLDRLNHSPSSLVFRTALQNLSREYDLLDSEYAFQQKALALQGRVIELAKTQEVAKAIADRMLTEPPIAKLFAAILARTREDGRSYVRIRFGDPGSVPVWYSEDSENWEETITVPPNLSEPLEGFVKLIESVGYQQALSYFRKPEQLPKSITVHWPTATVVQMDLP